MYVDICQSQAGDRPGVIYFLLALKTALIAAVENGWYKDHTETIGMIQISISSTRSPTT